MAVKNQRLMKSSLADNTTATTTTTTPSKSATVPVGAISPSMTMPPSSSTSSPPAKTLQATHTSAPTQTASPQIATHATININGGPRVSFNRDVHVKRIGEARLVCALQVIIQVLSERIREGLVR
uniref:Uncharacterized protein n=1 Tax=Glossina brevipalpis TaxID=37001 RepID=A0A1A9WV07_9MUSC